MNMDDKQRQIEEIAKDLEQAKDWAMGTVGSLNNGFGGWYGTYMYNQGYRKQSNTVREFVQKLFDISKEQAKGGVYTIKPWTENIINLAKQYGVEVEGRNV